MKKNSDSEYVVTESTRTEMLYDTSDAATGAYRNIQDAKEEAEFSSNGDSDMEESKNTEETKDENTTEASVKIQDLLYVRPITPLVNVLLNPAMLMVG